MATFDLNEMEYKVKYDSHFTISYLTQHFIISNTDYAWADWGGWSECSSMVDEVGMVVDGSVVEGTKRDVECGRKGIRNKSRYCHDINYCFTPSSIPKGTCLNGNATKSESCAGDPCVGV